MNKLPLKKTIQGITILRGILIVMLLLCLVPWEAPTLSIVNLTAGTLFLIVAAIEFWLLKKIHQKRVENPDERDVALMNLAANKAISYNGVVLVFLVLGLDVICQLTGSASTKGHILGFIGVNLPFFIKYCLYLHYEHTDEGEYYE